MLSAILCLLPAAVFSVFHFGIYVVLMYGVSAATCMGTELIAVRIRKRPFTLCDFSAVITGILLVMTLPPRIPIYAVVLGSAAAMILGKQIFGGLGNNIFNPALVGRAFLAATYPVLISDYPVAFGGVDTVSQATTLAAMKFESQVTPIRELFLGTVGGSVGETSALLLLVGAIYLIVKGYIKWRIPLSILTTVAVLGQGFHYLQPDSYPDALQHLLSGGLLLGALYMATDMVTSPLTPRGCLVFGTGIGILVVVIRLFGGLPEGVMYAVLFMNATVPLINRWARPRILGAGA
jgi:electron transport complex protein RnfD